MSFPSSAVEAQSSALTINGSVTLVESAQVPGAVRRATEDLQSDFAKVFGQKPRLVSSLDAAGPVAILIAERSNLPAGTQCATTTDREAFAFSIAQGTGGKRVVCLTGADMRGTIFAVYQFSQQCLGTDPMYLWTDKEPAKRNSITLPADFTHTFPSPVFKYRGFFINDEDLLTGWRRTEKGVQSGIALKTWDNVFETILRLKGNMIVPGTWIFPDDAQVLAASQRGLIVNQHHATPLGVNAARWPEGVPYNFSTHPEILRRAWKDAVDEYKPGDDILWSVGLRGLSDQSYAALDPSVRNNDPLLGKRISDAIADQIQIVRAKYPNAQFITNLWQEGDRLMREGYLKIPPEVTKVWADTGYGDMLDGGNLAPGEGMYIHVAMLNGVANQLSEMVPVERLQQQIGRYEKAKATGFFLVNTSDIRPVAMTTRAVMEMTWGGVPDAPDADGAYYRKWATEEFGSKSAQALEELYKAYFAAPMVRKPGPSEFVPMADNFVRWDGDQYYQATARLLILDDLSQHQVVAMPSQSPKWTQPRLVPQRLVGTPESRQGRLAHEIEECEAAQPRWDAVWQKALAAEKMVEPSRHDYYQAEVLTMITINREGNRMLLELARAMQDDEAGNTAKAESEAAEAVHALDATEQAMSAAEYGKWKNWYRGDWLAGVWQTRELVQDYVNHLKDPLARLPAPMGWSGWDGYFHIMEYEDDRSVDVQ
ncbi:MAG TPA: glycosyl hydrolase 115 family protein [Terracidiphilus sp.]